VVLRSPFLRITQAVGRLSLNTIKEQIMYKIILKRGNYATILKDGKELEAMAGIYVTTADLVEMNELINLANAAAQQKMHLTLGESAASDSESKPAPKQVI